MSGLRSLSYQARTMTWPARRITAGSWVAQITVWPSSCSGGRQRSPDGPGVVLVLPRGRFVDDQQPACTRERRGRFMRSGIARSNGINPVGYPGWPRLGIAPAYCACPRPGLIPSADR
jgi:hypothetical protein